MKLFNSKGFPYHRGRRLRSFNYIRDMVSENILTTNDLVMPYFVRENNDSPIIKTMNGIKRFSEDELIIELEKIRHKNLIRDFFEKFHFSVLKSGRRTGALIIIGCARRCPSYVR